jgi:broad specificity phosphatase PhoE
MSSTDEATNNASLRFYLVRHGETQANVEEMVVGQSDSPLTPNGEDQVQALGTSLQEEDTPFFWRIYSSDLPRTQRTTHILLDSLNSSSDDRSSSNGEATSTSSSTASSTPNMIRWDRRLRELAKGARQGYPKHYTEAQALLERQRLGEQAPLLETLDEGWERIFDWWREVIADATTDTCSSTNGVRNVLVVGHAGIFRVFLQRLLGDARLRAHASAGYDQRDGRFAVPNSSLTILQVDTSIPHLRQNELRNDAGIEILKLTDTQHFSKIGKILPNPP